jgi:hypothetical protein
MVAIMPMALVLKTAVTVWHIVTNISEEFFASFFKAGKRFFTDIYSVKFDVLWSSNQSFWLQRRNIPEDTILHSHRRNNPKSYIALTGWTL